MLGCVPPEGAYSVAMTTKSAAANRVSKGDAKYLTEMDDWLKQITAKRRDMKKTDTEIRRLEIPTRRKLDPQL